MNAIIRLACLCAVGLASLWGEDKPIDVARSAIAIHVGKAGLFSAAGHEHWADAPIASGVMDDSGPLHVELKVDAAAIRIRPDAKVDGKTQAEIQKNMQEITLESATYPEISFRSSRVERLAGGEWRVEGSLTLHGTARPIAFTVTRTDGAYVGRAVVRQTDFGIKPIAFAGGLVRVKNEVEIDFRVVTERQ